jgi:hypothetical protein
MTGQQIKTRAEFLLEEEFETLDAIELINLGLNDLSLEAPRTDILDLTVDAMNRSVTIPSDCLSIDQVWMSGVELGETDSPFSNLDVQGTPKSFFLVGNQLRLFPLTTTQQSLSLLVQRTYGSITDLSEEIVHLPAEFQMGLVFWLVSQFKYYDDEIEEGSYYTQEYYRYRNALSLYQRNRTNYSSSMGGM